jgi:hypothetical protein
VALSQLRGDIYGYYLEYIKQEGIIPFTLKFNSEGRLVGDFYGNVAIVDLVDEREREGVVKKAIEDLEQKLKLLDEGQIVFRVSPPGWTNMGYDYTETQTQLFWREGEKIRGLTIRTQADLNQIRNFLKELGVIVPEFSDKKELIKYLTSLNLILPYYKENFLEFIIKQFSQFDHRGRPFDLQIRNWLMTDGDFKHFDEIVGLIEFLESKLTKGDYDDFPSLLGFTLMVMVGNEMGRVKRFLKVSEADLRYLPLNLYDETFKYLQSLPGCAGSGGGLISSPFSLSSFGPIEIKGQTEEINSLKCVTCPFCNCVVDAEILRRNGKKFIHCPSCGVEVEMS